MSPQPNSSVTETSEGVNPPPQAQAMWKKVVEHEPLIRKCAASMVRIYHADFDELYNHLALALFDKATQLPGLLSKGDAYIFTCLKNEIRSYMRAGMNEATFSDVSPKQSACVTDDDVRERVQLAEDIRFVLEHLDAECRELVQAILDNGDLIRQSRRTRKDRPNRKMINVNALASKLGRPKSSVYKDIARLRSKLAPSLAIA